MTPPSAVRTSPSRQVTTIEGSRRTSSSHPHATRPAPRSGTAAQRALLAGIIALCGYLAARFLSRFAGAPADNAALLLAIERLGGLDVEGDLQRAAQQHAPWLIDASNLLYTLAYWPVLAGALLWTWRTDRGNHRLLRRTMLLTGVVGLVIHAVFPVTPPRLLPGYTDTIAGHGLLRRFAHPEAVINPDAAFPSFHVGWLALSLRLALAPIRRAWSTWVQRGAVGAMSAAVVLTANHYLLDIVAGLVLASVGLQLTRRRGEANPADATPLLARTAAELRRRPHRATPACSPRVTTRARSRVAKARRTVDG